MLEGKTVPVSETLPASCSGFRMISSHSHHTQEHNSLPHDKKQHQGFEIFPAQLCPISEFVVTRYQPIC